jgi:hypothetical protein
MPPLIARLNAMRREAGRDHLPFEVVMVLTEPWDPGLFRRAEDLGVTAIQLLPPYFSLGRRSTLDEKKVFWESFADKVLRHFPLAADGRAQPATSAQAIQQGAPCPK